MSTKKDDQARADGLSLKDKLKGRLFKEVKLPGWLLFFWGVFTLLPEVNEKLTFWWDAAVYLGGNIAIVEYVLTSPAFGVFLMISGVLYVVFVDESSRPSTRRKLWVYLAWTVAGAALLAFFVLSLVSYINQQIGPRNIYPLQAKIMKKVIGESTHSQHRVTADVEYVASCFDCDQYAFAFIDLLKDMPGWSIGATGSVLGPSRDSISSFGIAIMDADPSLPSNGTITLEKAFTEAGLPFEIVPPLARRPGQVPADTGIMISPRARR